MTRILIIRFTSFGDILQATAVLPGIKKQFPKCEVHWLVKENFKEIPEQNQNVDFVWSLPKKSNIFYILKLAFQIHDHEFSHIYDAHRSLRSLILVWVLKLLNPFKVLHGTQRTKFLSRSKFRLKRLLLFKFGINKFPKPFIGSQSFIEPLKKWRLDFALEASGLEFTKDQQTKVDELLKGHGPFICMAPSAAWPLKRWPVDHWKSLVKTLASERIVLLGGPQDEFCEDIREVNPEKVLNLAGKLSWMESIYVVSKSRILISGDTGVLHGADSLNHPHIALIGPTAFGYTGRNKGRTMELDLPCKPCSKDGRGKCKNNLYQKCRVELRPDDVARECKEVLTSV